MKIVFRVDASIAIGTGHVMRCRALATALHKIGASIQFISRRHPGHLADLLASDGYAITLLPQSTGIKNQGSGYAAWLGVSQQKDAEQTVDALEDIQYDWLVVDHYGLDRVWESRFRSHTCKLMVIDDLANRSHDCDVLLDQNYAVNCEERYAALLPEHCRQLLGPRFALLRPEYAEYREAMVPRTGQIKRVLVFMGGVDRFNVTGKVLTALSTVQLLHVAVDVVVGSGFVHKAEVIEQARARPNTHVHGPRPHLADLMAKADFAVGAGGGTTWERMCMGVPSLVLSIAENQVPACEALLSSGLIVYLGDAQASDVAAIKSALLDVLSDSGRQRSMATRCKSLVDGQGAKRVAEVLHSTQRTSIAVPPEKASDGSICFPWTNTFVGDRASRFESAFVDSTAYLTWFDRRPSAENTRL